MLIGRADTSKMLAPARGISKEIKSGNFIALKDGENLLTLWSDFYFLLTEPQKDYLNEKRELEDLKNKIYEIDFAIKSVKKIN